VRLNANLVRRILLTLETMDEAKVSSWSDVRSTDIVVPDVDPRTLHQHVRVLMGSPYVDFDRIGGDGACRIWLNLRGHDLVDMIRDEVRWKHARFCVETATGGCSLELVEKFISGHVISRTLPPT
jgi:hypothetical protein